MGAQCFVCWSWVWRMGQLAVYWFSAVVILIHRFVEQVKVNKEVNFARSVAANVWLQDNTHNELEDFQGRDSGIMPLLDLLEQFRTERQLVVYRQQFKQDGTGNYLQFVVPKALRDIMVNMMHYCVLAGHLGRRKAEQKSLQRFYWHQVREDVKLWVSKCEVCQVNKPPSKRPKTPLGGMIAGAPLNRLFTDTLGPFPTTDRGYKFVLWLIVIQNEIFAVPNESD